MEKPEIIWNYKVVQTKEDFTKEIYWHEYPIYVVSRDKGKHWEIIRAIYQHMRKLYQEKYPYYRKQIRTILYHSEPPFNLIAEFEGEKIIVWSSDPAVQEQSKQHFANWQQLENYYNDLLEYCQHRKEIITKAMELIAEYKATGKSIDYCPPNIRWTQYKSGLRITENYTTNKGKSFDNQIFIREESALEIGYQAMFDEILNYIISKKQDSELYNRNGHRQIQFVVDYLRKNTKMFLQFAIKDFGDESRTWKSDIVLWSTDQSDQENTKQRFSCWKTIEQYYNQYCERWESYCGFNTIGDFIKEREIKTERRIKREQNDPTNPAARKRKARRHLQRLGYDLHKSRKIAKTENDRGQYQIVKLDSGEVVAGKIFDLTLEQVEQFYMDADYARRNFCRTDTVGFLWNKEPNFEQRKEKVQRALQKLGYQLEVDIDDYGYKEYYNASCYRIRLMKNKYKVKYYTDWDKNKYLLNGENKTFTLSEVEAFIFSNS